MDIVIISEFGEDYSKTDNDRFLYLAKELASNNEVEIVTSSFRHTKKNIRRETVDAWPFTVTFVDEPGYPKNICFRRFYSHFIWGKNLIKYITLRKKPDVVYCAVPSLTGPSLVAKYCEKNNIRFIIDVQDLWPEAFRMIVNIPIFSKLIFFPFELLADSIYKRADAICAVSETYANRALKVNHKTKDATVVYLGTDLATFDRYALAKPLKNKKDDEIWLAYCGTLGSSYDLKYVFDAMSCVGCNISIIIMGDGPMIDDFKAYSKKKGVKAVFTGRLSYNQMCSLLKVCDIAINPIAYGAAQSIINKHADYAAAGIPIVSTQECVEYRQLIERFNMGVNCSNNDYCDLAKKICELVNNTELRRQLGINARKCAEECFDRATSYQRLIRTIEDT